MNPAYPMRDVTGIERLADEWCELLIHELDRLQAARDTLVSVRAAMLRRDGAAVRALIEQRLSDSVSSDRVSAMLDQVARRTGADLRLAPANVKLALLADRCCENTRRRLHELASAVKSAAAIVQSLRRGNEALIGQARDLFAALLAALGNGDLEADRYDSQGRRRHATNVAALEATC